MSKGLDLIQRQQIEAIDGCPTGNVYVGLTFEELAELEKELKDYSEIKEISKRYHFDDLARDTHMTTTDEKYLRMFNAAIPDIQADYRKARAFDIIKSHAKEIKHFRFLLYMAKYWEENKTEVTKELLENYDLPYTVDEFHSLKEALK